MTLSCLSLLLVPSVLALAMPALAEARQGNANSAQPRPLNLSLPRDLPYPPGTSQVDEAVQRNCARPRQPRTVSRLRPLCLMAQATSIATRTWWRQVSVPVPLLAPAPDDGVVNSTNSGSAP